MKRSIALGLLAGLSLAACGKKSSSSGAAAGGTISTKLLAPISSSLRFLRLDSAFLRTLTPGLAAVGQTTSDSLTSLKYYIMTVEICQDITVNGTGYSDKSGCLSLYSNSNATDMDYNAYTVTDAMADTSEDNFIDFMSAEGRAKFAKDVTYTSDNIGSYKWVLVSFVRPIKITGSFYTPGTTTPAFVTQTPTSGELVATTIEGRESELVRFSSNPTSGTPSELTYMLNNGGTYFPLLKSFEITQADVDAQTPVSLEFVFNPNNFAGAYQNTCDGSQYYSSIYNAVAYVSNVSGSGTCSFFDLPYAKMGAVPRKAGEQVFKEIYTMAMATGADLRVELYYNGSDSTKSIVGADAAVVYTSPSVAEAYSSPVQTYKITQSGNDVTFYAYNSTTGQIDSPSLTFTRGADSTATLTCVFTGGVCSTAGQTVTFASTHNPTTDVIQVTE